ncbi:MAG: hypothetical protein CL678_01100 [Bdellovibrionaceae bacterium]|nr:hypothetical protein [Pseudobdellovibrionaceae bacterium]|tara:strand:- start:330 stop:686 length:357 start_codon:yes stop_codon:yes gene_type:complete
MKWRFTPSAIADCVLLGIHVNDVEPLVRHRGIQTVRLSPQARLKIIAGFRTILRVRAIVRTSLLAAEQAATLDIGVADIIRVLRTCPKPGGIFANDTLSVEIDKAGTVLHIKKNATHR